MTVLALCIMVILAKPLWDIFGWASLFFYLPLLILAGFAESEGY